MNAEVPLISIILCTFNRKRTLARAIDSVLCQTYKNWELVIVDDGSTDGSERLLRRYAQQDRRIDHIRQRNKGLALARNTGLRRAQGQYVTFLDSDDEYTPRHLAQRMSFLRSHRNVDALFGGMKVVGPRPQRFVPDIDRPGKRIHVSRCHAAGTLVATQSALLSLGGFRQIPFSEDYDLIRRLQENYRVRRVAFRTYVYHVGSNDRLCKIYERDGINGILHYRRGKSQVRRK